MFTYVFISFCSQILNVIRGYHLPLFWSIFEVYSLAVSLRMGLDALNLPRVCLSLWFFLPCSCAVILLDTNSYSQHLVCIIPLSSGFHYCWVDFCHSNCLSFLCRWSVLSLAAFKIFSLSLMFCSFTTMCLGVDFLWFSYFVYVV